MKVIFALLLTLTIVAAVENHYHSAHRSSNRHSLKLNLHRMSTTNMRLQKHKHHQIPKSASRPNLLDNQKKVKQSIVQKLKNTDHEQDKQQPNPVNQIRFSRKANKKMMLHSRMQQDEEGEEAGEEGEEGEGEEEEGEAIPQIAGIESEESSYPIERCTQMVGLDGNYIADDKDWTAVTPAHLSFNIYNINVFATAGDATSLFTSMEWDRIVKPIKEVNHMPGCFMLESTWEKKSIMFCMTPEERALLPVLLDTFEQFEDCRGGIRPTDENAGQRGGDCNHDDDPNALQQHTGGKKGDCPTCKQWDAKPTPGKVVPPLRK